MLRLQATTTFDAVARINLKGLKAEFTVTFRLVPTDELKALQEQQQAGTLKPEDFVAAVAVGWPAGAVCNSKDLPLTFSLETLSAVQAVPGATLAMIRAFYSGYDEATEGNSAPLPAGS